MNAGLRSGVAEPDSFMRLLEQAACNGSALLFDEYAGKRSVRDCGWMYEYYDSGRRELYQLERGGSKPVNWRDPVYAERVDHLHAQLERWSRRHMQPDVQV